MTTTQRWDAPYLLYLGNAPDALAAKTARGVAHWRPELCIGQLSGSACKTTIGLPEMDIASAAAAGAKTLIVGVANAGGIMDAETVDVVIAALEAGMNVASGLHAHLNDHPVIAATAQRLGLGLFDARIPPATPVGNGRKRDGRRLLAVGTDCSVGKMYTTLALDRAMRARGLAADFRATGQTGIFIAGGGVPIDAVIADFISGGIEHLSPARSDGGWDLIEGQGSLFHPSFAGVSLGLLHGAQADALVMCHEPTRTHMRGLPHYPVPDLGACIEANLAAARLTNPGARFVGIALNTADLDETAAAKACAELEVRFGLPCQDPVRMGVERIIDRLSSEFPA
jgi:uncharacterized NAD-dependent epimerase/dehydratase family protein